MISPCRLYNCKRKHLDKNNEICENCEKRLPFMHTPLKRQNVYFAKYESKTHKRQDSQKYLVVKPEYVHQFGYKDPAAYWRNEYETLNSKERIIKKHKTTYATIEKVFSLYGLDELKSAPPVRTWKNKYKVLQPEYVRKFGYEDPVEYWNDEYNRLGSKLKMAKEHHIAIDSLEEVFKLYGIKTKRQWRSKKK